jgi:NDP-sugar pyrophosphorylase family protein
LKIVIPMSGVGRRFQEAGYADPKPLIQVDGKPIIEHVVAMFPGETDFTFICNREHLETTAMRAVLARLAPQGRIVAIEPHKKGPVHAVLQAAQDLPDGEPVVVNYCDFAVDWDWPAVKAAMAANGCDGAVPAYRGFHPHMLGDTNYAFMRDARGWMLEIQEKKPFTANRMDEYASSGTYCFRSGALVKRYFAELAGRGDLALNGEHYVSLVYNLLVRDGLKVWIPEVPVMLQWGTPQDLEEYQGWSDHFRLERGFRPARRLADQALIPMAGAGARFAQQGYTLPKPLIPVGGEPMVLKAAGSLPCAGRYVFAVRQEHLDASPVARVLAGRFGPQTVIVPVAQLTDGQARTCMLAAPQLDPEASLMIGASDNGMVWDEDAFAALTADPAVDAVVWTFRGHPHARRRPEQYGWVDAGPDGRVRGFSVKKALSDRPERDPGIVGAFWFRKARRFMDAAEALFRAGRKVNGEYYADSVMQVLVEQGFDVRLFDIQRFLCWGTPDDLKTYEYWERHFNKVMGARGW